jgi:hypothetical protein
MRKRLLNVAWFVAVLGCSSGDAGGTSDAGAASLAGVRNQVNACATKGATYLAKTVEHAGGTCGPIPDEITNTDDPAITAAICTSVTQENCVGRGTACKSSAKGCETSLTYMTTFKADGSSATGTGTMTVTCSDGSFCKSTYDYTMTRK